MMYTTVHTSMHSKTHKDAHKDTLNDAPNIAVVYTTKSNSPRAPNNAHNAQSSQLINMHKTTPPSSINPGIHIIVTSALSQTLGERFSHISGDSKSFVDWNWKWY